MKHHIKILKDGSLEASPNQKAFLVKHFGKNFVGEPDDRASDEKRRFIEGAIKPYFFYQHLPGVYKDFREAREGLKWACDYTKFEVDHRGMRREVTRSMNDIYASTKKCVWFIDQCDVYFKENGYRFPDPDHFKEWENSSPLAGAVYPPLQKLLTAYAQLVELSKK